MKVTLKDKAYRIIKSKIVSCEYKPNEFLSEHALMEEIKVGRTPIREALNKLEQENLITIIPKKGSLVSGITYNDIKNIFEVRELIEPYIVKTYSHKIDKDRLIDLKKEIEDIINKKVVNLPRIFETDDKFHKILIVSSENDYFINMYESIHAQNQRIRILSGKVDDIRIHETCIEHIDIIDGILNGYLENASSAMEQHMKKSKEAAIKMFINI